MHSKHTFSVIALLLFSFQLGATVGFTVAAPDSLVPRVFIKGEFENMENVLGIEYPKGILYPFNNNSQLAFAAWAKMLWEMERFGDEIGFDIRGIKAFATFYFNRNGQIMHIAYSLKGNSRYFDPLDLQRFFIRFQNKYRMNIISKYNFQHEFLLVLPYPRLIERD